MGGAEDRPLSVDEAKALLRETAGGVGVEAWVRRHPGRALALAFAAGWLAARNPALPERLLTDTLERIIAGERKR